MSQKAIHPVDLGKVKPELMHNLKIVHQESNLLHLVATGKDPHLVIAQELHIGPTRIDYAQLLKIGLFSFFVLLTLVLLFKGFRNRYLRGEDILTVIMLLAYSTYTVLFGTWHPYFQPVYGYHSKHRICHDHRYQFHTKKRVQLPFFTMSMSEWAQKNYTFWYIFLVWGTVSFFHLRGYGYREKLALLLLLTIASVAVFTGYSASAKAAFALSLLVYLTLTYLSFSKKVLMGIAFLIAGYILFFPWISHIFVVLSLPKSTVSMRTISS